MTVCYGEEVTLNAIIEQPVEDYHPIYFEDSDTVYDALLDIGFPFTFFQNTFTMFVIAPNGWISFNIDLAGTLDDWHATSIPSTVPSVPKNAIMFPWQDWYPYNAGDRAYVGYTRIYGPPDRLVINFFNVAMAGSEFKGTFQLKLFYPSNDIEVHLTSKPFSMFNDNIATLGLHNSQGTYAATPPGRNGESWEVPLGSPGEAWRFVRQQEGLEYLVTSIPCNPDLIGEISPVKWYEGSLGNYIGTGNTIDVAPLQTTTYIAEIWLNGVVQFTDAVMVYVKELPVANAGDDQLITAGNPVTLDGSQSDGAEPLTYFWQAADGSWSFTSQDPMVPVIPPPTTTTEYILQVTDANGCVSEVNTEEAHVIVRINNAPLFVTLSANHTTICKGDEVVLTANVLGGSLPYLCHWEAFPPVDGWIPDPDEYQQSVYPLGTTTFIFTVTDADGTIKTATTTVNVISVQPEIEGSDNVCEQQSGVIYATLPTGNQFNWTMTGPVPGDLSFSNNILTVNFGAGSGVDTIVVVETTNDIYKCTGTSSLPVIIHPEASTVSAGSDATICQGYAYQITDATASDYISLQWQHDGIGNLEDENTLNPVYFPDPNETGEITLTLTAQCGHLSDQMILTINPAPAAYAGHDQTICEGDHAGMVTMNDADATNYISVNWTTNGSGILQNVNTLSPTYYIGSDDWTTGSVTLTLYVHGEGICPSLSDEMRLFLEDTAFIYGLNSVELYDEATYSVIAEEGYDYTFTVEKGNITDQSFNSVEVQWISTGTGWVHLQQLNPGNSICNSDLAVNISSFGIGDGPTGGLSVYPNPADDQIIITGLKGHTIFLYNYLGGIRYKGSVSPVDIRHLSEGIYFLKIEEKDGRVVKIVKIIKL